MIHIGGNQQGRLGGPDGAHKGGEPLDVVCVALCRQMRLDALVGDQLVAKRQARRAMARGGGRLEKVAEIGGVP